MFKKPSIKNIFFHTFFLKPSEKIFFSNFFFSCVELSEKTIHEKIFLYSLHPWRNIDAVYLSQYMSNTTLQPLVVKIRIAL